MTERSRILTSDATLRLFALAGRSTKAQFVRVYGSKGPTMTWSLTPKSRELQAYIELVFGQPKP
jgi:hypothetical protein